MKKCFQKMHQNEAGVAVIVAILVLGTATSLFLIYFSMLGTQVNIINTDTMTRSSAFYLNEANLLHTWIPTVVNQNPGEARARVATHPMRDRLDDPEQTMQFIPDRSDTSGDYGRCSNSGNQMIEQAHLDPGVNPDSPGSPLYQYGDPCLGIVKAFPFYWNPSQNQNANLNIYIMTRHPGLVDNEVYRATRWSDETTFIRSEAKFRKAGSTVVDAATSALSPSYNRGDMIIMFPSDEIMNLDAGGYPTIY